MARKGTYLPYHRQFRLGSTLVSGGGWVGRSMYKDKKNEFLFQPCHLPKPRLEDVLDPCAYIVLDSGYMINMVSLMTLISTIPKSHSAYRFTCNLHTIPRASSRIHYEYQRSSLSLLSGTGE